MALIEFTIDETVAVVTLNSDDNRFNPDFLRDFLNVLDRVEKDTNAKTMVITSSHEKIFSNGIDLEWLIPVIQNNDIQTAKHFFYTLNELLKRLVSYPLITVGAINGHAFAGGAILACGFDFRFMQTAAAFSAFRKSTSESLFCPA
jgi:enoyl-CoA hydratase/carnithine racemase